MPALATGAGHEPGLYELLAALPSQLQPHVSRPEDNAFLQDMFGERSLHSLIKIHEQLQLYEESKPVPVLDSAAALAHELSKELEGKSANGEIKELLQLLAKPHVKVSPAGVSARQSCIRDGRIKKENWTAFLL
ncbi:MAGUK p55 subfamily member 7-like [Notothenia coriiceps]|uniref:MAGUK p55 subfamily member 7-like n=1 Tax=Notothenia coriiceps TaxID=8208 RepID=A0A6I9PZ75_9TELE|nr:PREDICTED: MAGUK p55 subfamily member 7-like [Notothenia coriiceps]